MEIDVDAEEYKKTIEKCFPQIQIRSVKPNDEGWDFFVLEINDELIFRFPRRQDGEISLEREFLLLPKLAKRLSVHIPHYEFVWNGDANSKRFGGYRKIEGVPLTREHFKCTRSKHLARQLSKLLSEFHRFPIHEAMQAKISRTSSAQWRQQYRNKYARVREQCFPLLDAPTRAKAASVWETFLADDANFQFKPVLIHADLGGEHILCDPNGIAGIIDWGDASIGDPALDFTGLLRVYGRDFAEQVLGKYQRETDSTFWQRLVFYSRRVPFSKILYGVNMTDEAKLKLGLEQLHAEMPNWK